MGCRRTDPRDVGSANLNQLSNIFARLLVSPYVPHLFREIFTRVQLDERLNLEFENWNR